MSIRDTASKAVAVTPHDSNVTMASGPGYLTCTTSGNANVLPYEPLDGTTYVVIGLVAGLVFPLKVRNVKSTSTTATGIVALYCKS